MSFKYRILTVEHTHFYEGHQHLSEFLHLSQRQLSYHLILNSWCSLPSERNLRGPMTFPYLSNLCHVTASSYSVVQLSWAASGSPNVLVPFASRYLSVFLLLLLPLLSLLPFYIYSDISLKKYADWYHSFCKSSLIPPNSHLWHSTKAIIWYIFICFLL